MSKMIKHALVVQPTYLYSEDKEAAHNGILNYEVTQDEECEVTDWQTLGRVWRKKDELRTTIDRMISQLRSGEYERLYCIYTDKDFDDDFIRENVFPKEDRYRAKSNKERFGDEYHICEYKQTPEKYGHADNYLHYIVSKAGPNVDVIHIDMNDVRKTTDEKGNEITYAQAYSVTKEYFAPVIHDDELTEHEANWATVLGYSGNARIHVKWLLENFTEDELYIWANGDSNPGHTPDKQIVKCPDCGEPTWASPASVGYKNYAGEYVCKVLDASQMKCAHCGADLSEVFSK